MENRHVCFFLKMTMDNSNVNTAVRPNGTPRPPTYRPMIKGKAWKFLLLGLACSQAAAKDGRSPTRAMAMRIGRQCIHRRRSIVRTTLSRALSLNRLCAVYVQYRDSDAFLHRVTGIRKKRQGREGQNRSSGCDALPRPSAPGASRTSVPFDRQPGGVGRFGSASKPFAK
jgi:hypothetical protein